MYMSKALSQTTVYNSRHLYMWFHSKCFRELTFPLSFICGVIHFTVLYVVEFAEMFLTWYFLEIRN